MILHNGPFQDKTSKTFFFLSRKNPFFQIHGNNESLFKNYIFFYNISLFLFGTLYARVGSFCLARTKNFFAWGVFSITYFKCIYVQIFWGLCLQSFLTLRSYFPPFICFHNDWSFKFRIELCCLCKWFWILIKI